MGERLTQEREAEIRAPRTRRLDYAPQVYEEWDDEREELLVELDAVRAELGLAELVAADRDAAHERADTLAARVRELEERCTILTQERDNARADADAYHRLATSYEEGRPPQPVRIEDDGSVGSLGS